VVLSRDKLLRFPLLIDERYQSFSWSLAEEPILVDLDPDRTLLAEHQMDWSVEAAKAYWRLNPMVWTRTDILDILEEDGNLLVPVPWNDPHWSIRARGTGWLDAADLSQAMRLVDLAKKDVHSEVRASAVAQLANESFGGYVKMAEEVLAKEQAYNVIHEALNGLAQIDLEAAFQEVQRMEVDSSVTATLITGGFYARLGEAEQLSYFDKSWNWVNGMTRLLYIKNYVDILHLGSDAQIRTGISRLSDEALAIEWSPVRRFAAFRGLALLRQQLLKKQPELAKEIVLKMDIIKDKEQDPELQNYYQNY
jgi:aminopeptidase N